MVPRDRHAAYFSALAVVAGAVERFAIQVRHWQRTEVLEAEEPFTAGQKGSSAMPHKRNPILSENLCGLARMMRAYAAAALENTGLWHERDISHSSAERMIAPDATATLGFMLERATRLIEGLVVYPARMAENLARTGGLWASEAVLLALVGSGLSVGRRAYVLVQRNAMRAWRDEGRFVELLSADPDIAARLSPDALTACFDLTHALRHAGALIDRALASLASDGPEVVHTSANVIDDATLRAALAHPLDAVDPPLPGARYQGKVRDNYSRADGTRVLVTTDRISAFDKVIGTLPFKGQVLSQLAVFWFERTREVAPNHLIAAPDPNVMIAHECEALPLEVVVRAYLTGVTSTSVWTAYAPRRSYLLRQRAARRPAERTTRSPTPS